MTDDFIKKLKNAEPRACRTLYDEYKVRMFSVCRRYAATETDARDMLQEGFMEVFDSVGTFKNQGNFEGFIKKVFLNKVLQFVRKNYRQLYKTGSFKTELHDIEIAPEAISNLSYEELLKHIRNLPDGYRTVFNLYAVDGYRHTEISQLLNITESTSRSQYSRAKQLLRKVILQPEKINIK